MFPKIMCQGRSNKLSEGPGFVTSCFPLKILRHFLFTSKFQMIVQRDGVSPGARVTEHLEESENQGGSTTHDVYDCCLIFSNLDE